MGYPFLLREFLVIVDGQIKVMKNNLWDAQIEAETFKDQKVTIAIVLITSIGGSSRDV